jgi:hypothetical protein
MIASQRAHLNAQQIEEQYQKQQNSNYNVAPSKGDDRLQAMHSHSHARRDYVTNRAANAFLGDRPAPIAQLYADMNQVLNEIDETKHQQESNQQHHQKYPHAVHAASFRYAQTAKQQSKPSTAKFVAKPAVTSHFAAPLAQQQQKRQKKKVEANIQDLMQALLSQQNRNASTADS